MNNLVQLLIPGLLLLVIYVLILTQKGEMQRAKITFGGGNDWITFIAIIFGTEAMTQVLMDLGMRFPNGWWYALIIPGILLVWVIIKIVKGKPIMKPLGDERINAIYTKSSRNALFATYLGFFVHLLVTNESSLDTKWVAIILGGGIAVLLASIFFYYFRKA